MHLQAVFPAMALHAMGIYTMSTDQVRVDNTGYCIVSNSKTAIMMCVSAV